MAKTLGGLESLQTLASQARTLRSVWTLRLVLGSVVLLGMIIGFLGTSWDIQWHSFIGRDRTLIVPHIMMLSGIALSGVAALTAVLIESFWARRNVLIARTSTPFADFFHSSLGAYVAGFAALNAAIAFPLDSYWHSLYGIDVQIWAPFHIMIIAGGAITALGAVHMLVSAAHLASRDGAHVAARTAYIGTIVAFATMMSLFTILLFDALDEGTFDLGFMTFSLFPVLSGLLIAWTLIALKSAVPWRWSATMMAAVSLIFIVLVALFVPPITDFLAKIEHLSYLRDAADHKDLAIVAARWPIMYVPAAILLDIFTYRAQRKSWTAKKLTIVQILIALIGAWPSYAFFPILIIGIVLDFGPLGFVASMLVGLVGVIVGIWFGRGMGASMQQLER